MIQKKVILIDLFIVAYLIIVTPKYAYAYIDPGSITILLQVLLAGIAGVLVAFRRYLVSFFRKLFKGGKEESEGK